MAKTHKLTLTISNVRSRYGELQISLPFKVVRYLHFRDLLSIVERPTHENRSQYAQFCIN